MELMKLVIDTTIVILSTRISFGNISFTLMSSSVGLAILGIVVWFITKIMDW